ncbi:helix-turn-helix domain-containing protein [Paraburkholderia tropica]|uniref:helix-turn-helix domain-containing protein n=1 Tax=Paraburkholderia tropica TaxID=92647 RepID=UPI002AB60D64|nr:helix-turn-helix transcriptional regulator [Paraburkholderia tropica]
MSEVDLGSLNAAIGRAVARHRVRSGLTQEQLGQELGLRDEAISRLERGVVMPSVAKLVELADIFDCNVADLMTEGSSRSSDQAKHLGQLLGKLNGDDRTMVLELVERLTGRLTRR